MSKAYEDKLLGKMPEELCMKFIDRYVTEQEVLRKEVVELENDLKESKDRQEDKTERKCHRAYPTNSSASGQDLSRWS